MDKGIRLKNRAFVSVGGSYGFDQGAMARDWRKYFVKRACGVAALANLWCYGTKRYILSEAEGKGVMNRLLSHASPRPWGIASPVVLRRGVRALKLPFRLVSLSGRVKQDDAYAFIRRHLEKDRPVALLNTNHPYRAFSYHWVTITEMFEEEGVVKLRFSSWGERYKLDFSALLSDKTIYRALVALVPM